MKGEKDRYEKRREGQRSIEWEKKREEGRHRGREGRWRKGL